MTINESTILEEANAEPLEFLQSSDLKLAVLFCIR